MELEFLKIKGIKFSFPTLLQNRVEWGLALHLYGILLRRLMEKYGLQVFMDKGPASLLACRWQTKHKLLCIFVLERFRNQFKTDSNPIQNICNSKARFK